MKYKRNCERCQKEFQTHRPHGKFCSDNCRVCSYQLQKRRKEKVNYLRSQIKEVKSRLTMDEAILTGMKQDLKLSQACLENEKEKHHQLVEELTLDIHAYLKKYEDKIDPLTNRKVISLNYNKGFDKLFANKLYSDRQKLGQSRLSNLKFNIMEKEHKINTKNMEIKKNETHISNMRHLVKEKENQITKLLLNSTDTNHDNPIAMNNDKTPSLPLEFSIGAEDLLNRQIDTFQLPGNLGAFLGELERNMLAIALVGDAGAGKSTLLTAIARAFDLAGFSMIFYSLELGYSKPLKDMLKLYPLRNHVRILDKGNLDMVRKSAEKYDCVIIDSYGKLLCKAEEWDKLRQDFPNTVFVSIFQKTSSGTSKGGPSVDYDASMVLDVVIEKESGRIVVHMKKNRYGTQHWKYYPEENRIEKP